MAAATGGYGGRPMAAAYRRGVGTGNPAPTGWKRYEYAVGTSIARPVCEANDRMRQQPIRPGIDHRGVSACRAGLDLPAANCPPKADRTSKACPYSSYGKLWKESAASF